MKRRVEFVVGVVLLASTAQTHAHAATARRALSPHTLQSHVPGYLGIGFHDANGHGVEIMMVDHDGPAGKAGLRPHDVILSLNGQAVNSSDVLSRMIHEISPGIAVNLAILRDGKTTTVKVQIADRGEVERTVRARVAAADTGDADPPVSDFVEGNAADVPAPNANPKTSSLFGTLLHGAPFTGLGLQTMEPQLAEFFGDTQGIGLLVQMVMPNSPAAYSGLRAGDVLLRADTVALKTPSDWSKRLRANQGQQVVLNVLREKHEITITLTPETKHHSLLEWPYHFGEATL